MNTWKQEFLVMVRISITAAIRYRGKGHLAYNMRILHVASSRYSLQLPSRRGWPGPFMITLKMHGGLSMVAQTIQLECPRQLARELSDRSGRQLQTINL